MTKTPMQVGRGRGRFPDDPQPRLLAQENMSAHPDPFDAVVAALEGEVEEYEKKANETRQLIDAIRKRRPASGMSPVHVAELTPAPALHATPAPVAPPSRPRKGETTELVLQAIRDRPGRTSSEIARALKDQLPHIPEIPKRAKLIHSTLGYLRDRVQIVRRDSHGGYFLIE
jgi:hypothetical protein